MSGTPPSSGCGGAGTIAGTIATTGIPPPAPLAPLVAASAAVGTASSADHFCLRWNNYQTNMTTVFDQLLQEEVCAVCC